MKKVIRLMIYPKDVQAITGRSLSYSRMLLKGLRREMGKRKNELVTIQEFCAYANLNYEEVLAMLNC